MLGLHGGAYAQHIQHWAYMLFMLLLASWATSLLLPLRGVHVQFGRRGPIGRVRLEIRTLKRLTFASLNASIQSVTTVIPLVQLLRVCSAQVRI